MIALSHMSLFGSGMVWLVAKRRCEGTMPRHFDVCFENWRCYFLCCEEGVVMILGGGQENGDFKVVIYR
jgi:hypothetical protein